MSALLSIISHWSYFVDQTWALSSSLLPRQRNAFTKSLSLIREAPRVGKDPELKLKFPMIGSLYSSGLLLLPLGYKSFMLQLSLLRKGLIWNHVYPNTHKILLASISRIRKTLRRLHHLTSASLNMFMGQGKCRLLRETLTSKSRRTVTRLKLVRGRTLASS